MRCGPSKGPRAPDKKVPSFKDKFKPEEIAAVIKHIRTLAPAK